MTTTTTPPTLEVKNVQKMELRFHFGPSSFVTLTVTPKPGGALHYFVRTPSAAPESLVEHMEWIAELTETLPITGTLADARKAAETFLTPTL
jgi:hypothetical protein